MSTNAAGNLIFYMYNSMFTEHIHFKVIIFLTILNIVIMQIMYIIIVISRMKLKIKDGGGEKPVWQIQEQIGDCQFVFTKPQKRSFDKSLIHLSADWFVPEVGRSPGHLSLGILAP